MTDLLRFSKPFASTVAAAAAILTLGGDVAHTQAARMLVWDESAAVTGFAVTVDGVRTDYGLSPLASDGTCGCAVAAPFLGGRHVVVVSAYDANGETSAPSFVVGPTANAGGPYSGTAGSPLTVSGAASVDQTSTIASYAWAWGDGTSNTTAASASASHVYANAGTYTITLTVADGDGATHAATTTASIASAAPLPSPPAAPSSPSPASGATNVGVPATLQWSAAGATNYDVYFGTSNPPPLAASNVATSSYSPTSAAGSTTYFWQIVARNSQGTTTGAVWSFTTAAPTTAASIARVQVTSKNVTTISSSTSLALASATKPGDWLGVIVRAGAANETFTITDSTGNIFRNAAQSTITTGSGGLTTAVFYAENIRGGADTITVKPSVAATLELIVVEYSGIASSGSIDKIATAQGTSASPNSGAVATSAAGELLLGTITTAANTGIAAGTGYSIVRRVPGSSTAATLALEQRIASASGSYAGTASLSASGTWGALLVAVRPASSAGGPPSTPTASYPAQGATNVSVNPTLSWNASGATSYDVAFGATNPPAPVVSGRTASTYTPTTLANATKYYWQIVARNSQGSSTSPVWSFTTASGTAAGPVAAFGFSEGTGTTTKDSSGAGLSGTLVNGPLWTTGRNGSALAFNGSSTYVDIGNPTALQMSGSMTLSAWVYETANVGDDGQFIAKSDGMSGWQLKSTPDTGVRTFGIAISDATGAMIQRYSKTVRALNTWYHVAGVYDAAARTLHIYVNGVLDDGVLSGSVPGSMRDSTVNVNVGRRTGGFYVKGTVDDARVYNRALSQAEIQADMNAAVK